MAFLVEDGTGLASSNSYASVADADAYHEDRFNDAWVAASTAEKQVALIKATDYIDSRFSFVSTRETDTQALEWPRDDYDGVPTKVKQATYEYALRSLSNELAPDPSYDDSGYSKVVTREKVGPIETEYYTSDGTMNSTPTPFRPYPLADALLSGLILSSRMVIR